MYEACSARSTAGRAACPGGRLVTHQLSVDSWICCYGLIRVGGSHQVQAGAGVVKSCTRICVQHGQCVSHMFWMINITLMCSESNAYVAAGKTVYTHRRRKIFISIIPTCNGFTACMGLKHEACLHSEQLTRWSSCTTQWAETHHSLINITASTLIRCGVCHLCPRSRYQQIKFVCFYGIALYYLTRHRHRLLLWSPISYKHVYMRIIYVQVYITCTISSHDLLDWWFDTAANACSKLCMLLMFCFQISKAWSICQASASPWYACSTLNVSIL